MKHLICLITISTVVILLSSCSSKPKLEGEYRESRKIQEEEIGIQLLNMEALIVDHLGLPIHRIDILAQTGAGQDLEVSNIQGIARLSVERIEREAIRFAFSGEELNSETVVSNIPSGYKNIGLLFVVNQNGRVTLKSYAIE